MSVTWHVEAIAYQLERVRRGEIRRLIINMPPRSLKSIAASVAFPAFVLGHDPSRRDHLRQLFRRPRQKALQRLPRRARIAVVSSDLPHDADRAVQELGDRDRTDRARISAGDVGRRNADRPRRRHHRHRRSAEAGRRLFGNEAFRRQSMVHQYAALPSGRQAHRRDRRRHAARSYRRSDRISFGPIRRMGGAQPSGNRRIRPGHSAFSGRARISADRARPCRPSANRSKCWKPSSCRSAATPSPHNISRRRRRPAAP